MSALKKSELTPIAKLAFDGVRKLFGDRWQSQLAELLGVTRGHIHNMGTGARALPDDLARKIAEVLITESERRRKDADAAAKIAAKIISKLKE
ncbi:MAG: helix-turn-helix transcriptional regulator [Beijerinckiaceae bacterium]|nr:helix-turn-helix transcriptional regulator [Beijerinckiaceae bacterium]